MAETASQKAPADIPPPVEMVRVRINDMDVEVPKTHPDPLTGKPVPTTMIQACEQYGVEVPHYCYHPKLPVAGNCRMCLVEYGLPAMDRNRQPILNDDGSPKVQKMPRPAIACATPISPGMEIYTDSPGTMEMRQSVLEFLLINHPLDCPICDQAGECKLQEYSYEHGQSESRFVEKKVHKPKQVDLGPRIMLDDERCILCSRCVRFSRDIAGDDALGFVNRGSYNTLAAYPGRSFDNNYTLNTVDLCPVGALTSKDFRFKMRAWFLKETKSLCNSCGTGCNTLVGTREEVIYRQEPRENNAVNSSWMCDYGRLNYHWQSSENRLKAVTAIRGDIREVLNWSQVIGEITPRLQSFQPGQIAFIGSGQMTTEEVFLFKSLAEKLGGTVEAYTCSGESDRLLLNSDRLPNTNGLRINHFTTSGQISPSSTHIAEGIKKGTIKALFVIREDVTVHGISTDLLESLDLLIVSDIHRTPTTDLAHYVLPGAAHFEKRGTFVNVKGRIQKFMKAVEAPGDARPEWEFLHEMVHKTIGQNGFSTIEGLFNLMAQKVSALQGLTWASLGDFGVNIETPDSR